MRPENKVRSSEKEKAEALFSASVIVQLMNPTPVYYACL